MQHRRKRAGLLKSALLGAATLGAISIAGIGVAQATPMIHIGLQEAGYGSPLGSVTDASTLSGTSNPYISGATNSFSGGSGSPSYTGSYGTFSSVKVGGSGDLLLGDIFTSNSLQTQTDTAGILKVYVTETGISDPTGPTRLFSGFNLQATTSNVNSVKEATYYNSDGATFGTENILDSATFGQNINNLQQAHALSQITLGSSYSVTELFTIDVSGKSTTNATISMHTVPEPGSLALLGTGLLGLGLVARRRRRKV